MFMRNTCLDVVSRSPSRVSHTQPVPSIAAWLAGPVGTLNTASADAGTVVVPDRASMIMGYPQSHAV